MYNISVLVHREEVPISCGDKPNVRVLKEVFLSVCSLLIGTKSIIRLQMALLVIDSAHSFFFTIISAEGLT